MIRTVSRMKRSGDMSASGRNTPTTIAVVSEQRRKAVFQANARLTPIVRALQYNLSYFAVTLTECPETILFASLPCRARESLSLAEPNPPPVRWMPLFHCLRWEAWYLCRGSTQIAKSIEGIVVAMHSTSATEDFLI